MTLELQGDYAGAQSYFQQVLKISKKVFGAEHPRTASALNDLGLLLKARKDFDAAQPYLQEALEINRKVLGEEHLNTANAFTNLGVLLHARGDYAAAKSNYEHALQITRKSLGKSHPATISIFNQLSSLILEQASRPGKQLTAAQLSALEQAELLRLAAVKLHRQGQTDEAIGRVHEVIEIRKKILGEEHVETATGMLNLGVFLEAKRDYKNAEQCYESVIETYRKVLGKDHLTTSLAVNCMGNCLRDQAKLLLPDHITKRS